MPENMKKSLKQAATELSAQIPLMEGREKGSTDDLIGVIVTIRDYGFLKNDEGDYAVFVVDEEPKEFFFGGTVLTDKLHKLDEQGYHDSILEEGLPMVLTKKKGKNKMTYTNVGFYPESEA